MGYVHLGEVLRLSPQPCRAKTSRGEGGKGGKADFQQEKEHTNITCLSRRLSQQCSRRTEERSGNSNQPREAQRIRFPHLERTDFGIPRSEFKSLLWHIPLHEWGEGKDTNEPPLGLLFSFYKIDA